MIELITTLCDLDHLCSRLCNSLIYSPAKPQPHPISGDGVTIRDAERLGMRSHALSGSD